MLVKCLAVLIMTLGLSAWSAHAQESRSQMSYDEELPYWLRAEQLHLKCGSLNYFEDRLIDRAIDDIVAKSSIVEEAGFAVGRGEYNNTTEARNALLAAQRADAAVDVALSPCDQPHADINFVRSAYMRHILYMLAVIRDASDISGREPVRTQIVQELFGFAMQMYGQAAENTWIQLMADADSSGHDPEEMWGRLRPVLTNALWELALGRKGYKFTPIDPVKNTYRAVKTDGSGTVPVTFRIAHAWLMPVDNQQAAAAIRSYGLDENGRLVFAVVVEDPSKAPKDLKAQMFVQEEPGFQAWDDLNWREGTLTFDGSLMDDNECPAMYCFRFDESLSAALRFRRNDGSPINYRYEIYIATSENFPVATDSVSAFRQRYYGDEFLNEH